MEAREIEKRKLTLDDLAHTEGDVEFWYAREIMSIMGYSQWRRFEETVKRAMLSAETSEIAVQHHFAKVGKMITTGKGASREVGDYRLTRYACYLVAMNGDVRKDEIAFAQSYFALQTRENELIGQRMLDLQRLVERNALSESERLLAGVAFERGVDSRGFATIKSRGDRALFGGHDTRSMKRRLGVPAEEDAKKLERRVRADERKLQEEARGFSSGS